MKKTGDSGELVTFHRSVNCALPVMCLEEEISGVRGYDNGEEEESKVVSDTFDLH